ncbi:MAG: restriction endonuclease subunit S, partial [Methylocella sp.]
MSFSANVSELVGSSDDPLLAAAEHWDRIELKKVATILNGYPWRSDSFNDRVGAPVIRIRDVTSGQTKTFYDGPIVSGYWIENGDLIVGMDGDFNCLIWSGGRALLNQRVCKLAPNESQYSKRLLAYILPGYLKAINEATHSITVKHLSSKTIAEIPLPQPPIPEQRRIVAKLDSLTGRTARARDELGRIPRLIQKYRESVIASGLSGAWTGDGAKVGWTDCKAKELFTWSSGKFLPKSKQANGRIPVYGGNGINGTHDRALVDLPTIVVGRVGAQCGNVYLTGGPAWITDNAIFAQTISE